MFSRLTDDLNNAEGEADRRIGEGHDGGEDGEPPNLIKVWDLREEDLCHAEHDHVRIAGYLAGIFVSFLMKAI